MFSVTKFLKLSKIIKGKIHHQKNQFFPSNLDNVDMEEKGKSADFIIQQIHVKPLNVTIKDLTKGIHIIADMEMPGNFKKTASTMTNENNI